MDEAAWLACGDPDEMFGRLHATGAVSDRKVRLFACACVRRVWPLLTDPRSWNAVEMAELYADGLVWKTALAAARSAAAAFHDESGVGAPVHRMAAAAARALTWETATYTCEAAGAAAQAVARAHPGNEAERRAEERRQQAALVRDVFGNPFRPLPARPFPAAVLGLAETVYAAFPAVSDLFPILADALDDLGEDRAAAHCREGLHVKGCHVVDWVLGKS
jgi:hypothetical protein